MKMIGTLLSLPLLLLGAIFVQSAFHPEAVAQGKMVPRLIVGAIILAGAGLLLVLVWWPRARQTGDRQAPSLLGGDRQAPSPAGIGVPGQLSLKALTCPHCGGQVTAASAALNAEGTLSVTCDYCKGVFLVQEEPKW
jgi:hypothetical protein